MDNDQIMNITYDDSYSYDNYRESTDSYLSNDNRELNYQNRIIIPMLEKIFVNKHSIKVVDVSTQYKQWATKQWHDRSKYAGFHTPDVLVAKNWSIYNRDNSEIDYYMLIEVKTPNATDRKHAECEVNDYLNHVPNVILTDLVTWDFYTKSGEKIEIETFTLEEEQYCAKVCERGKNNKKIHWKELEVETDKFLIEELGFPLKRKTEPIEWEKIIRKLQNLAGF